MAQRFHLAGACITLAPQAHPHDFKAEVRDSQFGLVAHSSRSLA